MTNNTMQEINYTELIEYARTWIGTPWQHNQCCRGSGVDCIRFTMDCYVKFGVDVGEIQNYQRQPRGNSLRDYLKGLPGLIEQNPMSDIKPGQLLLFRVKKVPHHVGIATSEDTFIHANNARSNAGVVEQSLDRWRGRIVSKFNLYA